jgi:hypothetical protein
LESGNQTKDHKHKGRSMKKHNIGKIAGLVAAVGMGMGASTSALGVLVDLATGNSGSINGANFQWVDAQSTGTGLIDPFSQLQRDGGGTQEASYNTPQDINPPFQQSGSLQTHNKNLLLSSIPIVGGYYQFLLDIGEGGGPGSLLSLNQLQVFRTSTPDQTGGSPDTTTGRLILSGPGGLFTGTSVYDMNSAGSPTANSVLLDGSRNSGGGSGDMFLYIPVGNFAAGPGDYVVLYSQFGTPPGTGGTTSTPEEWSRFLVATPVPEPTTMIAGALLLLPFAASTLRMIRKNRTA